MLSQWRRKDKGNAKEAVFGARPSNSRFSARTRVLIGFEKD